MKEVFIVDAVRTAGARRGGRLANVHANLLAAFTIDGLLDRTGIDPGAIEDVIMGCVTQAGEQAFNIARNAVFASKLPTSVPGVSIDRQCGSSQQAIHFAAQAILAGSHDVVIAAGVESMTRVPMGSALLANRGTRVRPDQVLDRFGVTEFSQFDGAERIALKHGFSRDGLDRYAFESHQRAAVARDRRYFEREILPLPPSITGNEIAAHTVDEGIRDNTSIDALAQLSPLVEGGLITAGNASQICDGSAAVLLASAEALKKHDLSPLARIVNMTVTAGDPVIMLEEPLFATEKALLKAGLRIDDIDLYEVNEAFASVPMAWIKHLDADPAKLNSTGGAIALGHPLGATGAKLMATLVHGLQRTGGRYGLQTMCEGGGMANVTIVESV